MLFYRCLLPRKTQKSVSIPVEYYAELEQLFEETKNACAMLEISSASELLRVLSKLGRTKFLEIVEQVRREHSLNPGTTHNRR